MVQDGKKRWKVERRKVVKGERRLQPLHHLLPPVVEQVGAGSQETDSAFFSYHQVDEIVHGKAVLSARGFRDGDERKRHSASQETDAAGDDGVRGVGVRGVREDAQGVVEFLVIADARREVDDRFDKGANRFDGETYVEVGDEARVGPSSERREKFERKVGDEASEVERESGDGDVAVRRGSNGEPGRETVEERDGVPSSDARRGE